MKTIKTGLTLLALATTVILIGSCKDKDPSVAKIFVRSNSNELLADTRVVLIADIDKNESTIEYVDTLISNSSGFVEFNIQDYFEKAGKTVTVANFDILCRRSGAEGVGTIRTRVHTTAVETIHLNQ